MKRFIFFVLFALAATQIEAKTIHWLTFFDTTDRDVGEIDKNTRNLLYSRWIDLVNATLNEEGYSIDIIDVYGNETTPQNCRNIVNGLQCGSDDIVVFYYVGHGTENTGASKFPLMLMAQLDINKFIPLSWVHNTLKSKGARLTITIGMCCNARQGVPGRTAPSFSANYGATYVDQDMANGIKKMFLEYRGDLIVTSASPNESSWTCYSDNFGSTDFFTITLLEQFNNVIPNKANPTWEAMLEEIKEQVYDDVLSSPGVQCKRPGATQTALWESNIVSVGKSPVVSTPPAPAIDKESDDGVSKVKTILNKAFAYISSAKVDEIKRMAIARECEDLFEADMMVRIMSQDGNVVVDKEPISRFLGRISTTRLLMNVSVVSLTLNATGKIGSLRVREVYKRN